MWQKRLKRGLNDLKIQNYRCRVGLFLSFLFYIIPLEVLFLSPLYFLHIPSVGQEHDERVELNSW